MDYLTVAEIANKAGITSQAVYKRLSTSLQPYVKLINGRKMIHISALEVLGDSTVANSVTNPDSTSYQPVTNPDSALFSISDTVKILQEQLEVKDNQIKSMNDQLRVKDEQINAKDRQINDLNNHLEKAMRITEQNNFIAAQKSIEGSSQRNNEDNNGDVISEQHGADDDPGKETKLPWYKRIFQ